MQADRPIRKSAWSRWGFTRRVEKGNRHCLPEKVPANFSSRNSRPLPTRIRARMNTFYVHSAIIGRRVAWLCVRLPRVFVSSPLIYHPKVCQWVQEIGNRFDRCSVYILPPEWDHRNMPQHIDAGDSRFCAPIAWAQFPSFSRRNPINAVQFIVSATIVVYRPEHFCNPISPECER